MTNPAQLARLQGNNQEAGIAGFGRFGDLAGLAWLAAPAGLAARAGWPGWASYSVSQKDWLAGWGHGCLGPKSSLRTDPWMSRG